MFQFRKVCCTDIYKEFIWKTAKGKMKAALTCSETNVDKIWGKI